MSDSSTPPSPLSPHRAFVVQFRAETAVALGQLVGRVEHVVSGQATTFATLDALLAFIARVLAEWGAGPPEAGEAGGRGATPRTAGVLTRPGLQ
jgi:hypothetical protein